MFGVVCGACAGACDENTIAAHARIRATTAAWIEVLIGTWIRRIFRTSSSISNLRADPRHPQTVRCEKGHSDRYSTMPVARTG